MRTLLIASILFTVIPTVAAGQFTGELLLGDSDQGFVASAHSVSPEGEARPAGGSSLDSHTDSYGIRGSYQLFKYVAAELGYQQYGKFAAGAGYLDLTLDADSFNVGIKGILPLSETYSLNARVGLAYWDMDARTSADPNSDISKFGGKGNDPYYGLGADYQINQNIIVGLNYSVVTMRWGRREYLPNSVFVVDYEHDSKNIALSLGVRF